MEKRKGKKKIPPKKKNEPTTNRHSKNIKGLKKRTEIKTLTLQNSIRLKIIITKTTNHRN
jgi:hypothetical protein